jgi:hypothetical protein
MSKAYGALIVSAAAATAIAGILHLMLVPNSIGSNMNTGVFFLAGGILQLFWILPMIRQWGRPWYYIGIGGTAVLIMMWVITRFPNPITGRAGRVSEMAIAIEALQVAFIVLTALILASGRFSRSA